MLTDELEERQQLKSLQSSMAVGKQYDKKGGSSGAGGKRKIDSLPSGERGRPHNSKKQKLTPRGKLRKENEKQG